MVGVAAVSAQMAGLGMFFGLVAPDLSAAFSSRVALGGTVGVALVAYLAQSILSLNDSAQ